MLWLDFCLAFDTFDHSVINYCLHIDLGCTYTVLEWFLSQLTYQVQSSVYQVIFVTATPLNTGIFNGSVFALFLLQCI